MTDKKKSHCLKINIFIPHSEFKMNNTHTIQLNYIILIFIPTTFGYYLI